jgi:RNA polymerase primary sigma factor
MRRATSQLTQELGREPHTSEIAEALCISRERVIELQGIEERPTSLDAPVIDDESLRLEGLLEDEQICIGGEESSRLASLYEAISGLSVQERQIIEQFLVNRRVAPESQQVFKRIVKKLRKKLRQAM